MLVDDITDVELFHESEAVFRNLTDIQSALKICKHKHSNKTVKEIISRIEDKITGLQSPLVELMHYLYAENSARLAMIKDQADKFKAMRGK